jgi:hypothetical protein
MSRLLQRIWLKVFFSHDLRSLEFVHHCMLVNGFFFFVFNDHPFFIIPQCFFYDVNMDITNTVSLLLAYQAATIAIPNLALFIVL